MSTFRYAFQDRAEKPLCLDFANTVSWHESPAPQEKLLQYSDLLAWTSRQGLVTEDEATQLLKEASRSPSRAKAILDRAIELRETVYRVFAGISEDKHPDSGDLDLLGREASVAYSKLSISMIDSGFGWNWGERTKGLDFMIWPVAKSTADLLTSGELGRVRQCANEIEGCGWLFMDTTKNGNRRWCDMRDCGNRAKARRHYEKKKASK
jgi:predicted RNA-binding Zn ribbon-like protein